MLQPIRLKLGLHRIKWIELPISPGKILNGINFPIFLFCIDGHSILKCYFSEAALTNHKIMMGCLAFDGRS